MMPRPPQKADAYGYSSQRMGVATVSESAQVVVPLVLELFQPAHVVDVGCGLGDWLWAFRQCGNCAITGYDGPWVPKEGLKIPQDSFHVVELYNGVPELPRADLAMCLEVAEHVAEEVGRGLVKAVCSCADVVLWSAAIPGQGGHEHINEHYQDYWIDQFRGLGFEPFDLIRPRIWGNPQVSWWYQQNLLVFANARARERHALVALPFIPSPVHPQLYDRVRDPRNYGLREMLRFAPHYLARLLRRR